MGTRTPGQIAMFVSQDQLPQAPTAPFFDKLNELLATMGFDTEVETLCRPFYAERLGRPSLAPGVYFRLLLLGIDSERGIALTVSDSLSLRAFLGYELSASPPEHSTISRTRRRISLETHEQVFAGVLEQLREAGLANGSSVAVDATMLFANAALRTLRRKDTQQGYREFVEGLAAASGVAMPTVAELAEVDRKRKGKTLSNKEWESPTDADARVAKMKDGTTHLAHIPEPQRAKRDFEGKRAVEGNRERVGSAEGKQLQKLRTEKVERSMAHMYETGAMRRLHLRGRENIRKRLLVHASAFNLGVLMRSVTGIGTPRTLQGQGQYLSGGTAFAIYAPLEAALSGILGAISRILAPDGQNRTETGAELA